MSFLAVSKYKSFPRFFRHCLRNILKVGAICLIKERFIGTMILYRSIGKVEVEVFSCKIVCSKAYWLRRYSVAKSKPVFSEKSDFAPTPKKARFFDPRSKMLYFLLKALQITFPKQNSDPKSVRRFSSYCLKTLQIFAKKLGQSPPKSALVSSLSVLLSANF